MKRRYDRFMGALFGAGLLTSALLTGCAFRTESAANALRATPTVAEGAPQPASGARRTGSAPPGMLVAPAGAARPDGGFAVGESAPGPAVIQSAAVPVPTPLDGVARGITVSGTGRVSVRPDEAIVSAGVQTLAQNAQDAQAQNNRQMQAVISAVKALNIAARDIQTSGVSLYPVYGQGQTLEGYNATNQVTVTVENVDQAGQVLDAVVRAGANQTGGIRFGLKDDSAARNKALAAAASDARSKADALAGALGVKITSIQAVAESSVSVPVISGRVAMPAAAASQAVPVEPGQLAVTAQVTVVFGY